jgi:hypothetical protein
MVNLETRHERRQRMAVVFSDDVIKQLKQGKLVPDSARRVIIDLEGHKMPRVFYDCYMSERWLSMDFGKLLKDATVTDVSRDADQLKHARTMFVLAADELLGAGRSELAEILQALAGERMSPEQAVRQLLAGSPHHDEYPLVPGPDAAGTQTYVAASSHAVQEFAAP